jgi:hypothetical protein
MGKYKDHEEFGGQAPVNYREETTSESYLKGMTGVAPPGMKPKAVRGQRFEEKTDFKASALWHKNYDQAMLGASDIGSPDYLNLQKILEGRPGETKKK